jgi:hypothetical protein
MIEKKIHKYDEGYDKPVPPDSDPFGNPSLGKELPVNGEQSQEPPVSQELPEEEIKDPFVAFATAFCEVFGSDALLRLRSEGLLNVPFTDATTPDEQWVETWVRMMFSTADAENMMKKYHQFANAQQNSDQEKQQFLQKMAALESRVELAESAFAQSDAERKQLKRDLLTSVSAVYLIDKAFPKGASQAGDQIAGMLKDEMDAPGPDYTDFLTGFLEGWSEVETALKKADQSELAMEAVYNALSVLLDKISGKAISRRRSLLDLAAVICSAPFNLYQFISPEESLQVDPRLHSATAVGGSTIREGISFAVIRKDTRQTVKYAEIRV